MWYLQLLSCNISVFCLPSPILCEIDCCSLAVHMTIKSFDVFAGDCYYSIVQVRSYGKGQDQKHSLNLS